jgi:hypothetical protein
LLVTGSRTFGAVRDGAGNVVGYKDPGNVVSAVLSGLWQEGTVGYLSVDLDGFTLLQGGAKGADLLARRWALGSPFHSYTPFPLDRSDPSSWPDEVPFECLTFDVDWDEHAPGWCWCSNPAARSYCPAAGHRRNQRLLDEGRPTQGVAFVDKPIYESRGTADMVARLREAGVPCPVVEVLP